MTKSKIIKIVTGLGLLFIFISCSNDTKRDQTNNQKVIFISNADPVSLNRTDWQFSQVEEGAGRDAIMNKEVLEWTDCSVPGSVQTALLEAGQARVPWYYEDNIMDLIHATLDKESIFRKIFTIPEEWTSRIVNLCFKAVDYEAVFFLNGQEIGQHEGHFERVHLDISKSLRFGEDNELIVLLKPFIESYAPHGPERTRTYRSQILKNMLTDCTPPVCPLGISDDVFIFSSSQLVINDLCVRTELSRDFSKAKVELLVELDGSNDIETEVRWRISPLNFSGAVKDIYTDVNVVPGHQKLTKSIQLDSIALWWPNGYGEQNLYEASVMLTDMKGECLDKHTTTFGIRKVEVTSNPGSENSWLFEVNGRKVFLKGSNWVPMNPFYMAERTDYARLLLQAKVANMNTLRWWGGGVPERDAFYELCDELGIMIYQDFPLANDPFDNKTMLNLLRKKGADFFRRLRNHPCILAWNGGNEWFSPLANAVIDSLASEEDPSRVYFLPCGKQPGEIHGPYRYNAESHYKRMNNFTHQAYTEFGCAAMANFSTIRDIIPLSDMNLFDTPVMTEKHPAYNIQGRMAEYECEGACWRFHNRWWASTPDAFGKLDSLEQFIVASQFLGGEGLRYSIESLRRRMYRSSVSFPWQFNETWPNSAGNASVDWFGRPRLTHYFISCAYEPVHASLRYDRIRFSPGDMFSAELWATNDLGEPLPHLKMSWEIFNAAGKKVDDGCSYNTLKPEFSSKIEEVKYNIPTNYDSYLLVLCTIQDAVSGKNWSQNDYIFGVNSSDTAYFSSLVKVNPAILKLDLVGSTKETTIVSVENTGQVPVLFCQVDLGTPNHDYVVTYSDNGFCLPPSGRRIVEILIHAPGTDKWSPDVSQIKVSAWKID